MASPISSLDHLCVHTATTRPWPLETAVARYAEAGVAGITVWRDALEGRPLTESAQLIQDHGLNTVSLCRGGFFPGPDAAARQRAIKENLQAIEEASAIGAPLIVLVCGAVPGQPLHESRDQIIEGIEAILPEAEQHGIRLAIEPLHPMYADNRSAISTLAQANDACDRIGHELVGVAVDVYHLWWDDALEAQIARCGEAGRLFAFHVCDWLTPTRDLLNDRGLMGEGCIPLQQIRGWVEAAGFDGFHEVEIFSERWWDTDQDTYLAAIVEAYQKHC